MRKVEWANTDTRIEIEIDGKAKEVSIYSAYEDVLGTQECWVSMTTHEFYGLMNRTQDALRAERRDRE